MSLYPVTLEDNIHQDDPVRIGLTYKERVKRCREFLKIVNEDGKPEAAICITYCTKVPVTLPEMFEVTDSEGTIAIFYTVWSYKKGAGRTIINKAVDYIKQNNKNVKRFVTLSPQTEMAKRFHLNNGAITLSNNARSDNYDYVV